MYIHPLYGPVVPEKNWVPAPSFLMRRQRILKMISRLQPGKTLEVGCGSGTLLYELGMKDFSCQGLESSAEASSIAQYVNGDATPIYNSAQQGWTGSFDIVMAMEVLEHIENDSEALSTWRSWLRPNGSLLLSVPAHNSKWTDADVWAGHFRRYEKEDLIRIIENAGFRIDRFESWGFPLSNLLLSWRARLSRNEMTNSGAENSREQNNAQSGINREETSKLFHYLDSWPGKLAMRLSFLAQNYTVHRDWGTGYLVQATKTTGPEKP